MRAELQPVAAVAPVEAAAAQGPGGSGPLQLLGDPGALALDHRLKNGDGVGQAAGDVFGQGLAEGVIG